MTLPRPRRSHAITGLFAALSLVACEGSGLPTSGEVAPSPAPVAVVTPPLAGSDLIGDSVAYIALLGAEDRRAPTDADLETLRRALGAESDGLRRAAVRAIGRLERPGLAPELFGAMSDADPDVRAEAANAVTQAVRAGTEGERSGALDALLTRFDAETDPGAAAAIARALGRIPPVDPAGAVRVAAALAERGLRLEATGAERLGIARGVFFHLRATARGYEGLDHGALVPALDSMLHDSYPPLRRTALAARRGIAVAPDAEFVDHLAADADPGVRRELMAWAGSRAEEGAGGWRRDVLHAGLQDPAAEVRLAAVQGWNARFKTTEGCEPLIALTSGSGEMDDSGDAVALAAVGALDADCPDRSAAITTLTTLVASLAASPDRWHLPAQALVALSRLDPVAATEALPPFVAHPNPFVRAQAASAAGAVGSTATLGTLAADSDANVREAALGAAGADTPTATLLAQLDRDEPQLLRVAARLLAGRDEPGVTLALLGALERVSQRGEATLRDGRLALVARIGQLGDATLADRLRPFSSDPDPAVAQAVAAVLTAWTGIPATAAPTGLTPLPLPSFAELAALEDSVAEVTMAGGDVFTLAFLPFEAPTNAARFARMAREGRFDGLTWHRVVPNFVVQGGSPGANEYAGHGAFTRDEIGLVGHWQGTLGISTRGRDTGDGQPFFNLVDNLRLDHDYTVFAYLIEGLDGVRRVRAGDRIESIRLRAR